MYGSEHVRDAIAAMERLGRRDFLKFAAASAGVAVLGIALPAEGAPPAGIRFMGEAELKVFQRLAEVTLPVQGTALVSLEKIPVMKTLDAALLGAMEPHVLKGLKAGIALFEQGPVKAHGKPFSALDDKTAAAFCDAWAESADMTQRGLVTGLKKLVTLAYWANPPTWEPLGYDGPVSAKWGLVSIGNAPMPSE